MHMVGKYCNSASNILIGMITIVMIWLSAVLKILTECKTIQPYHVKIQYWT